MQHAMNEMVNLGLFFTAATAITELPATATIVGISVMDLINVHLARSNSPQVKVSCDRQVASTAVSVKGGAHSQWLGMQWKFDIHKVSAKPLFEQSIHITNAYSAILRAHSSSSQ